MEIEVINKMHEIIVNQDDLKDDEINDYVRKVKLVILNNNNQILLVNYRSSYEFPGGTNEEGEELIETVNREIEEELGLKLRISFMEPFAKHIRYYKNYKGNNQNKKVEINYYALLLNKKPNKKKMNLTAKEKAGNFNLRYIDFDIVENILNDNIRDFGDDKGIVKEMLNIVKLYKENSDTRSKILKL